MYLGQQPVVGRYILLDQISGGFNGTASGFTMSTAAGAQGVVPGLAQNVLLSLGGVIQQPGVDYTISGSGLTFTTPPVAGTTFFATVLGDAQSVGTPSDGTVTPASIASGFDFVFPNLSVTGVHTIASGSAAVPSLTITGDTDTGLFSPAANVLAITTSGSTAVTISGSRVGIGTTATQQILTIDVNDSGTTQASFNGINIANTDTTTNNGSAIIFGQTVPGNSNARIGVINTDRTGSSEDQEIFFASLGGGVYSERMRIDSSGRLLIGTDTTATNVAAAAVEIIGNANTGGTLCIGRDDTTITVNNNIGSINFRGNDADGTYEECAEIACEADGTHGNTTKPSRLTFSTTPTGATSSTERMRIDSGGRVIIGNDTNYSASTGSRLAVELMTTADTILEIADQTSGFATFESVKNSGGTATDYGGYIFRGRRDADDDSLEYLRINHLGDVGIGATPAFSNGNGLEVARTGTACLRVEGDSGNKAVEIYVDSNGTTIDSRGTGARTNFAIGGNGQMLLTNEGRLLIGTTTTRSNFFNTTWTPRIQAEASTDQACTISLVSSSTGNNQAGILILGASRSEVGGNGATNGTQGLGIVSFQGNDGSTMIESARIQCVAQGTPSTDNVPARLVFSTNSGAGDAGERMRIQPNGFVNINKAENQTVSQLFVGSGGSISFTGSDQSFGSGGNRGFVDIDGTTARFGALGGGTSWTRGVTLWVSNSSTSASIGLEVPAAGITGSTTASAANVHVDGSNILRRSTSSRKYKTNIETIENSYSDALLNVRPVWYRSTADADNPDHGFWGFIAEEVAEIDPRLVNFKTYTETFDDQGNSTKTPLDTPEPEGVQYDRFVPHLLNLIKRQKEQIEAMEARLAALEAT